MEMQHSAPSKMEQLTSKQRTGQGTRSKIQLHRKGIQKELKYIYFSLISSQSLNNQKYLNCCLQKTPGSRVNIPEAASDTLQSFTSTDQHSRNAKMTLAEALLRQITKYSACSLQKFTWQSFYFVYLCLAKHLSNTGNTSLRVGSSHHSDQTNTFVS